MQLIEALSLDIEPSPLMGEGWEGVSTAQLDRKPH
jgi:hypothetical protein